MRFDFKYHNETECIVRVEELSRLEKEIESLKVQLAKAVDTFNIILMLDISGRDNQGKIASVAREFLAELEEETI